MRSHLDIWRRTTRRRYETTPFAADRSWIAFPRRAGAVRKMMALVIRQKEGCRWDQVSLGEVMLRFDPGEYRIWTARQFTVSEGGGEYNVARGLKRCFGMDAAVVTAFAKNPVGALP